MSGERWGNTARMFTYYVYFLSICPLVQVTQSYSTELFKITGIELLNKIQHRWKNFNNLTPT